MLNSTGLPRLTGPVTVVARAHQPDQALDQLVDVAERARLAAVAVEGDVPARERLDDEVGDHPAVVGVHARPVGVEDPRHLDLQPVLAVIVEEQGLGAALALVVAGARAQRVDVAPIVLALRVDLRVAIDLATCWPAGSSPAPAWPGPAC